jgi:FixJ family two-component response regulator
MTKKTEPIPFAGMVEIDDEPEVSDKIDFAKTQREVANELGITRSAVGLMEKKAMKQFKQKFLAKFKKDDFI